mmetsp:Transcript_618/g.1507  ORF Transcript_618/g.1507 Transcript_618/m.1507 type:complete len:232 (+) Transcript_618:544-1239(+)
MSAMETEAASTRTRKLLSRDRFKPPPPGAVLTRRSSFRERAGTARIVLQSSRERAGTSPGSGIMRLPTVMESRRPSESTSTLAHSTLTHALLRRACTSALGEITCTINRGRQPSSSGIPARSSSRIVKSCVSSRTMLAASASTASDPEDACLRRKSLSPAVDVALGSGEFSMDCERTGLSKPASRSIFRPCPSSACSLSPWLASSVVAPTSFKFSRMSTAFSIASLATETC